MEIWHRITFRSNEELQRLFQDFGFGIAGKGLVTVAVAENHRAWSSINALQKRIQAVDVIHTTFSSREMSSSDWFELIPEWQFGYPGPRPDEFGYLAHTYAGSTPCESCGAGLRQSHAFRLSGEPKWGKFSILQLNWIFDEVFVTPQLWEKVCEPLGINCRPVENLVGGALETIVQLEIDGTVGIRDDGQASIRCETCGTVKFAPSSRGFFPGIVIEERGHLCKTREYFGSGSLAFKAIIGSKELVKAVKSLRANGVRFRPCAR